MNKITNNKIRDYKVKYDDNKEYFDYHYIFELDREKERDNKLNSLLNE